MNYPELTFLRADYQSRQVQMLLTDNRPSNCRYYVLAFVKGKLIRLLEHENNCHPPLAGSGFISTRDWMGFWERTEKYRLDQNGTILTHQKVPRYPVHLPATVRKNFAASPATCPVSKLIQASSVIVTEYDSDTKRYLVVTPDNRCGWISEDLMGTYLSGLLMAG